MTKLDWRFQYLGFNLLLLAVIILSIAGGRQPLEDFWLRLFVIVLVGNGSIFFFSKAYHIWRSRQRVN